MPVLHFEVQADLVIGGCTHKLTDTSMKAQMPAQDSFGGMDTPSEYYLHSWIGDKSYEHSIQQLKSDGTGVVKMKIEDGDVNTLKLEYNFVCPSSNGPRCHQLCSSFIPISDLMDKLGEESSLFMHDKVDIGSTGDKLGKLGTACSFFMKDNFNNNGAVLKFKNVTTDIGAVRKLNLQESALLKQDTVNQAVFSMGTNVKAKISTCNVSTKNAGPQFMDGFTFHPMQGVLTNYGLMGYTFQCLRSPVGLAWTMYNGYKTLEATGVDLNSLASLSDASLVANVGNHLVTRHTSCALSSPYSPDLTFNATGRVVKDTEEISMSLSAMQLHAQVLGIRRREREREASRGRVEVGGGRERDESGWGEGGRERDESGWREGEREASGWGNGESGRGKGGRNRTELRTNAYSMTE